MVEKVIFYKTEDIALLKIALAKKLYSRNFSQLKISEILKISQPMISYYCSSNIKIPNKILNNCEFILKKIIDNNFLNFNICLSFGNRNLNGFKYIAEKQEIISNEKSIIFNNLTEAYQLLKGKNIGKLIPAVKINIAMIGFNTRKIDDVGSYLNGLIIAEDKIIGNNGIRFGTSKHLSSLLLNLKNKIDINAIMNIAFLKNVNKTNYNFEYLTREYKLRTKKNHLDLLLHRGDFGIEPCSYIVGKDAIDVAKKMINIRDELT